MDPEKWDRCVQAPIFPSPYFFWGGNDEWWADPDTIEIWVLFEIETWASSFDSTTC